jgi:hypothetical protein
MFVGFGLFSYGLRSGEERIKNPGGRVKRIGCGQTIGVGRLWLYQPDEDLVDGIEGIHRFSRFGG